MKLVKDQPQSGQYIAVWTFLGKIWANTHIWEDGQLFYFSDIDDDLIIEDEWPLDDAEDVHYIILK